ncbi:MAG: hypothetical protein JWL76_934 [Thermoleophilia bacterium]|nr:hypothetical protein [Thermoleophilia bacterium]
MSTARSAFTEAIEEHLALKKANVSLETAMPLARYDVGDPLDRYPGGPNRAADGSTVVIADDVDAPGSEHELPSADATQMLVGPSPEQAMEAAIALEPAFADRPFEPLNGMIPMLSLVEDIDGEDSIEMPAVSVEPTSADVLRFPGGVGPRDEAVATDEPVGDAQLPMETHAFNAPAQTVAAGTADHDALAFDAPTGEQPVLVIDADEPLATSGFDEPIEPSRGSRKPKPRFFGLGRGKKAEKSEADGWFTDGPRDFNWD